MVVMINKIIITGQPLYSFDIHIIDKYKIKNPLKTTGVVETELYCYFKFENIHK